MPKRRSWSAVMFVDIAGASLDDSADFEAPLTTFSSSTSSSPLVSCARATEGARRARAQPTAHLQLRWSVVNTWELRVRARISVDLRQLQHGGWKVDLLRPGLREVHADAWLASRDGHPKDR